MDKEREGKCMTSDHEALDAVLIILTNVTHNTSLQRGEPFFSYHRASP
jgi:hypothetical protein